MTWHKDSEEKPTKFDTYLCKLRNPNSYELITWVEEGKYSHWYTDNDNVYAWAEVPECDV